MQLQKCYVTVLHVWRNFDNTGFKIKHTVHIISGSALSSLKNACCSPVSQLINNVWYYHTHVNQGPDQQASLRQQCQAVHYDHCPGLLIFHTHLSAGRAPNAAALNAVRALLQCGVDLGRFPAAYQLVGHRQLGSTACPGNSLFSNIQSWPRWTPNPTRASGEPIPDDVLIELIMGKEAPWATTASRHRGGSNC